MIHKSNPVGNEITCIMYGINDAILKSNKKLEKLLVQASRRENFKILNKIFYSFRPYGFTGILLIQESHIAIHAYPEYNCLVFNLYSCRGPRDGREALDFFRRAINPASVDTKERKVRIGPKPKSKK